MRLRLLSVTPGGGGSNGWLWAVGVLERHYTAGAGHGGGQGRPGRIVRLIATVGTVLWGQPT